MATTYDVLAYAHELIQQGWCQGRMAEPRGNGWAYCALGALATAGAELIGVRSGLHPEAVALVTEQTNDADVARWNDVPERTYQEVLAVFARAAEKARVEGEK